MKDSDFLRSIQAEYPFAQELLGRFLHYVSFDTQSDPCSESYPSTAKQLRLLGYLLEELLLLGLAEVEIDAYGYVMATIPPSEGCESLPVLGFLAHVDTSSDASGASVSPKIHPNYSGEDLVLEGGVVLSAKEFPELRSLISHTLITSDGTTLLGADNKAGVAEIVTLCSYLIAHPEVPHPKIRIAFTPDEEVGRGVEYFDLERFGAQFAYTVDGGAEGELEYENFNAASAEVSIQGRNIHPGSAKDKMINALQLAVDFQGLLPANETPECTEGYEGFFHLHHLEGDVSHAQMHYLIRDHDRARFERRKELISEAARQINATYGRELAQVQLRDQYYNMRERVEPYPELIERAQEAMRLSGVVPVVRPIRGGTDGAQLSFKGLPTPNLFTGGANFHGVYEYCSLDSMCRAVQTLIHLVALWAK